MVCSDPMFCEKAQDLAKITSFLQSEEVEKKGDTLSDTGDQGDHGRSGQKRSNAERDYVEGCLITDSSAHFWSPDTSVRK